jgi:purine-nucleoside phosphorylase
MQPSLLDTTVMAARAEMREMGVPDPSLLFLCGTGLPTFVENAGVESTAGFRRHGSIALERVQTLPDPWRQGELTFGVLDSQQGPVNTWLIEDHSLEFAAQPGRPAFESALLIWIAAAAGAQVLVHTSAGGSLPGSPFEPGDLCIVSDYLNLSGGTPLLGLGESKLGPMFPDLTRLFSDTLMAAARRQADVLGITANTGIVAATTPVSLATPAEREWYRTAGADAWSQGLATPFLAAGHAGFEVLALVALIDAETPRNLKNGVDVPSMLAASEAVAPVLDDLLNHLAPLLASHAFQSSEVS